ncbi:unnamed protein product [Rotaria socialis]|uniref:Glucose-methanol-choline oxidoreductase N-terminal domain-containing protein n=1 Tax=Rotaria socialis TaxID=392032 RepID=A0A820QGK1_9BILA|nr:unnamed protein product [Rotaria socialis]
MLFTYGIVLFAFTLYLVKNLPSPQRKISTTTITEPVAERWERDFSQTKIDGTTYNYIIVGSGSARSVLANRLSEQGDKRALFIEVGGANSNDEIHMPCACGTCQRGDIDWQYKTIPQLYSHFGCANQQSSRPRDKVLGGCASINYMQYVRGDPHDYDSWKLPQWSFEKMLPYFKKLERADSNTISRNNHFRNYDHDKGMMDVTMLDDVNATNQMFIEACVVVKRISSLDEEEFIGGKEVILSAGAIEKKLQIPVIIDLPGVGKNLQYHLCALLFYLSSIPTLSARDLTPENLQQWATHGRGLLTSCGIESLTWCQLNEDGNFRTRYMCLIFKCILVLLQYDIELFKSLNLKLDTFDNHYKQYLEDGSQWTVVYLPTLLHSKSKGEITLASSDPLVHPVIDPNYLAEKEDVHALIEGCKLAENICRLNL